MLLRECFGQYGSKESEVCDKCGVKVYCERYVIAGKEGCPEEGKGLDLKDPVCKVCVSVFDTKCKEESKEKVNVGSKRKGVREWMDKCLEEGVWEDEFKKLAIEKWGRRLSIREHAKYREQNFGWKVSCEEREGRRFWKLQSKGGE